MKSHSRISRLGLAAVLTAAMVAPLSAQTVRNVRIAVVDPSSGQELAVINPGDEISMAPGQTVTLRLFEPQAARKRDRAPLAVESFGFGDQVTPLKITGEQKAGGEATVRLDPSATPGQKLHVGFKLADRIKLADPGAQLGKVVVRVVPATVVQSQEYYVPGSRSYGTQIDALVDGLYRGILMREPDATGSAGWRQSIAVGGFQAARNTAMQIAQSQESVAVSQKASPEQRLDALYQNLLGMAPENIDPTQWSAELSDIQRGNIAGVVDHMLNSPAFRYRYGFYYGR